MFSRTVMALDIGSYTTKALVGKETGKGVKVEEAFIFSTPADTILDGQIKDLPQLKEGIARELGLRKIKTSQVIYSVASSSVIVRELVLPSVKDKELAMMVSYEVEKHLPIQQDEYILDFVILEKLKIDGLKKTRLMVGALPKHMAEDYWQLARELQLKPVALTLHASGISKLFQGETLVNGSKLKADSITAFIDIGHCNTNCHLIAGSKLLFNRVIPLGGRNINAQWNVASPAWQEVAVTCEAGVIPGQEDSLQTAPAVLGVQLEERLSYWLQEVRRVFRYFASLNTGQRIERIKLFGGCSNIPGLAAYVEGSLEIPASVVQSCSAVAGEAGPDIPLNYYFNALGAIHRS